MIREMLRWHRNSFNRVALGVRFLDSGFKDAFSDASDLMSDLKRESADLRKQLKKTALKESARRRTRWTKSESRSLSICGMT